MRGSAVKVMSTNEASSSAPKVKGVIQRYFPDIKMGTVKSDRLDSYSFHFADWAELGTEPSAGKRVTFEVKGNRARNLELAVRLNPGS